MDAANGNKPADDHAQVDNIPPPPLVVDADEDPPPFDLIRIKGKCQGIRHIEVLWHAQVFYGIISP